MVTELLYGIRSQRFRKFLEWFITYRYPFLIIVHVGIFLFAYWLAYFLRFDGLIPQAYFQVFVRTAPLVVLVEFIFFYYHDLYRGLWRYVSFADLQNILRAGLMSMLALIILDFLLAPFLGLIPRSILALNFLLVVVICGGSRFMVRHLRERYNLSGSRSNARRVMLVGPVAEAEPIVREMLTHNSEYIPVVIVDPNQQMLGFRVYDVPIVGGTANILKAIEKYKVQEIIFAWPGAPEDQLNEIVEECKRAQVRFKKIPPLSEVIDGRFRMADVRDIELEDLLPRPPIYIDQEGVGEFLRQRRVLVTGAGGSIGSELCRQIARFGARHLLLIDRNENNLYEVELNLRRRWPDLPLTALICSINDAEGLRHLCHEYRPEVIFHAAAYKHVPLMERCPLEAAYNNILGTRNLALAAQAAGAEYFVMISTDKAVNPTSVMGVSKRIAERYVQACNRAGSPTKFIVTRFGNVLGSAGSVIPIFKAQLAQGGPLLVTHPEIERFFMTIPEAVQLVLQAAYMGQGGEIFVLKMGRPVKIRELAEKLIILAGKMPGRDIEIRYIGLRPGEKMYEELFNIDEVAQPSAHPMIQYALGPRDELAAWEAHLEQIRLLVHQRDQEALLALFKVLVPNYQPPE